MAKPPTPIAQRANLTNMATIWCDFHTQENCTSRTTVTTPDSSTELTAPDSSTEVTTPDSSTELPTFTTGQVVVVSVLGGICCILMFIFAYKRCRAYQKRVEEALHREKIRDAVRAKIAEVEGLEDPDTMRWYTEEPHPMIRWGNVTEIGPDRVQPTLRILYHPFDSDDFTQIKKFELTYDQVFGRPTSISSSHRTTSSLSCASSRHNSASDVDAIPPPTEVPGDESSVYRERSALRADTKPEKTAIKSYFSCGSCKWDKSGGKRKMDNEV